jgi:galactokinase
VTDAPVPPTKAALAERARVGFRARFGRDPEFIASAPGRVNLIGDHVDYAGGVALPMALNRWTAAAGAWSPDVRTARLHAIDLNEPAALDLYAGVDEHGRRVLDAPVGHWSGYIAGVFAELMLAAGRRRSARAVDLVVTSSIPIASGLSSSAALEVSVGTLLNHAWALDLPPREVALACQRAEHLGGGVRCGAMDQLASATGAQGHALLIDFADLRAAPVAIHPDLAVLVIDTRTPRALAAGRYDELVARVQRAERVLGAVPSGWTDDRIAAAALDPEARASALHIAQECRLVHAAAVHLASGDARSLAATMAASHASLRDRLGVSCPELEAAVAGAVACGPDVGARLTGAGMGGCAVAVCPDGRAAEVADHVRARFHAEIGRSCEVIRVTPVAGASVES